MKKQRAAKKLIKVSGQNETGATFNLKVAPQILP